MRIRTLVILAVSSLLWSSVASAQNPPGPSSPTGSAVTAGRAEPRHVVDAPGLRQAVADQATTDEANRRVVLGVLQQSRVQELAASLGLSVTRASDAVSTLSSAELADLAGQAQAANAELAGGANNTVTLSVTTLLLILILVILVAR